MTKKPREPRDLNRMAASIVENATTDAPAEPVESKNPAAVALGRLGGLKGGRARAEKLTAAERSAIAKRAAAARWGQEQDEPRNGPPGS